MRLLLLPGDVLCDLANLPREGDHRQILRTFLNTIFWGVAGTLFVLTVLV